MRGRFSAEELERLDDAYELRFRAQRGPLSGAWFIAYFLGLLGVVYGAVTMHYVFATWPHVLRAIRDHGPLAIALATLFVLGLAATSYRVGRTRGPVVPEPGHLEVVVAADLPRRLTLRASWWSSVIVTVSVATVLGLVVTIGLTFFKTNPLVLVAGLVLGFGGGVLVVYSWLRGQARGHRAPGTRGIGATLDQLPMVQLRTQSLMTDNVGSALLVGDVRRARSQAFTTTLRRTPTRIPIAGPYRTVLASDLYGLLRVGVNSLAWAAAVIASTVFACLHPVFTSGSPLVLPLTWVLAQICATGLTRGLQHHAGSAGQASLLGISWHVEMLLHLLPIMALQLIVGLITAFVSGAPIGLAIGYPLTFTLALAAGQVLYSHKGPPPISMMIGPSRGAGVFWAMHPAIVVALAALATHFGGVVIAGVAAFLLAYTRASGQFDPNRRR